MITLQAPASAGPADPAAGDARWAAIILLLYVCVVGVGIVTHELWRDEWQAWMLARDSTSLAELFQNLRYEGHPAGWYILLYAISRVTRDVAALQLLQLFFASGAVYLLARYAPLSRSYRALIAFGYFFVYEYGVISRSYSMGVLALFAFCALFPQRRRHPIALALTLALLASTVVYGLIIALAAGLTLALEIIVVRVQHRTWKLPRAGVAFAGLSIAGIVLVMILGLIPPADATFVGAPTNSIPGVALQDILTVTRIWESYVPIPRFTDGWVWNSELIPRSNGFVKILLLGLSASILAAAILLFLRKPYVLCFYVFGTAGLLLFSHLVFGGTLRHNGYHFILFVASLWLSMLPSPELRSPEWLRRLTDSEGLPVRAFLLTLFAAQVVAGGAMYAADLSGPFSPAEEVARYLRNEGLANGPIAVSRPPESSPIAGFLDRPIYHLDTGKEWTYVPWNEVRGMPSLEQRLEGLRGFLESSGQDVIVIFSEPVERWDADLRVVELARFDLAQAPLETYYVYKVARIVTEGR